MIDYAQIAGVSRSDPKVSIKGLSTTSRAVHTKVSGVTSFNSELLRNSLVSRPKIANKSHQLQRVRIHTERGGPSSFITFLSGPTNAPLDTERVFALLGSENGKYILREPITLEVTDADHDGIYVVSDEFSTSYGCGDSRASAIHDYSSNLFADFEELEEDEEMLGVALQRELEALRLYIARR